MSQSCINGPSISVYNDKAVCAYRANDASKQLYVTYSQDATVWSMAYAIPGQTTSDGPATISFLSRMWIAYKGTDGHNGLYITHSKNLSDWSTIKLDNQSSSAPPSLAIDTSARIWMSYRADDSSYALYYTRSDDGLTWVHAPISGESTSAGPAIIQFNGFIRIFFKSNDSSDQIRFTKSNDAGTNWSASKPLFGVFCKNSPSISFRKSDNRLYMAYQASNGSGDIYVASSSDGEIWIQNNTGLRTPDAPRLVVFNDTLLISYEGTGDSRLIWGASSADGVFWQQPPKPIQDQHFFLAMTADPQLPWEDTDPPPAFPKPANQSLWDYAKGNITAQYTSINALAADIAGSAGGLLGMIANGDLTAFGSHQGDNDKENELSAFKDLLKILKVPSFLGLGNHDYQNNVNDSFQNFAASGMVDFMYRLIKHTSNNFDFNESHIVNGSNRLDLYQGSLAYSFSIGAIRIIQCHNYPTYSNDWVSTTNNYHIRSSLDWLKDTLRTARSNKEAIIICFHDFGDKFPGADDKSFSDLVSTYSVSGIFVGHIHSTCGLLGVIGKKPVVPVFRCGSPQYGNYLLAEFDIKNKELNVQKVTFDLAGVPHRDNAVFSNPLWM